MAKPMTKTEWLNWLEKAWGEAQQAAWNEKGYEFECPRCGHCCQQKEWVGLTDEEVADYWVEAFNENGLYVQTFAKIIEDKLKEKNGG